jgi:hypothetical protein
MVGAHHPAGKEALAMRSQLGNQSPVSGHGVVTVTLGMAHEGSADPVMVKIRQKIRQQPALGSGSMGIGSITGQGIKANHFLLLLGSGVTSRNFIGV